MKNEWKGTRVVDGDHIVDEIWCGVVCLKFAEREREMHSDVCV